MSTIHTTTILIYFMLCTRSDERRTRAHTHTHRPKMTKLHINLHFVSRCFFARVDDPTRCDHVSWRSFRTTIDGSPNSSDAKTSAIRNEKQYESETANKFHLVQLSVPNERRRQKRERERKEEKSWKMRSTWNEMEFQ